MTDLTLTDLRVTSDDRVLLYIPALTIPTGTLVGISGPSGAGKTTLLNALSGLIPVQGRLQWGSLDLSRASSRRAGQFRRDEVGMIFQDFLLFEELSALDNATMAASFRPSDQRTPLRRKAIALMETLGLGDKLSQRVDTLSGGERQRVATVRALAHDPAILLADEPTASLDRATADALMDDLAQLARAAKRTVITVSHDPKVLARMDRIITLSEGQLVDE